MKKNYAPPVFYVSIIEIEDSYCNASSNIQIGINNEDYMQEWDEIPDDTRNIQW